MKLSDITKAERAYWRSIWRQAEKEQRFNQRVLMDLTLGTSTSQKRARRSATSACLGG